MVLLSGGLCFKVLDALIWYSGPDNQNDKMKGGKDYWRLYRSIYIISLKEEGLLEIIYF